MSEDLETQLARAQLSGKASVEEQEAYERGRAVEQAEWVARSMELATWSDCEPYPWGEKWHPRQVLRFLVADMSDRRENAVQALAIRNREQQAKALDKAAEHFQHEADRTSGLQSKAALVLRQMAEEVRAG